MPTTNPSDIHDTATCACEQCVWADNEEKQREEAVLGDVDAVVEAITIDDADIVRQLTTPRGFAEVLNRWTDTMLDENHAAREPATIALILRLGTLGQRLLYEAHALGLNEGLKVATRMMKERGM